VKAGTTECNIGPKPCTIVVKRIIDIKTTAMKRERAREEARMVGIWVWHIAAGLVGVLLSLSLVYRSLERRFTPHRAPDVGDVASIADSSGRTWRPEETADWLNQFRAMPYLGRIPAHEVPAGKPDIEMALRSGEQIRVFYRGPYWVVVRQAKPRRSVAYRLYALAGEAPSQ
jgi:hypothetical protein